MNAGRLGMAGLVLSLLGSATVFADGDALQALEKQRAVIMQQVNVLAEELQDLSWEIGTAEQDVARLREALSNAADDAEYAALQARLRAASNRLAALNATYSATAQDMIELLDELQFVNDQIDEMTNE